MLATADGRVVGENGLPRENVFAIGPMLRGARWETTAANEIRAQAGTLADTLLAELDSDSSLAAAQ